MVVALLVGGFAGCSTLQSIAECSNVAGEYGNVSRRASMPRLNGKSEEVCAK